MRGYKAFVRYGLAQVVQQGVQGLTVDRGERGEVLGVRMGIGVEQGRQEPVNGAKIGLRPRRAECQLEKEEEEKKCCVFVLVFVFVCVSAFSK